MINIRERKSFVSRRKKITKFAQTTVPLDVYDLHQTFRDPLRGELPHVKISMNDGPNPLT